MKKLILLVTLIGLGKCYAQGVNGYNNNRTNTYNNGNQVKNYTTTRTEDDDYDQIRIVDTSQEIRADILPYKTDPKIKNDRYYYWYLNNVIHSTQGGYNGKLLNGHYVAFYPDKNLKEEGDFKRGLKDGMWKTWNRKGDLTNVTTWDEGIAVPDNQQSIWKKMQFFKKKDDQQSAAPAGN
jgi:antitoxin component YwqK of YwqJK toxin-antitoxin module